MRGLSGRQPGTPGHLRGRRGQHRPDRPQGRPGPGRPAQRGLVRVGRRRAAGARGGAHGLLRGQRDGPDQPLDHLHGEHERAVAPRLRAGRAARRRGRGHRHLRRGPAPSTPRSTGRAWDAGTWPRCGRTSSPISPRPNRASRSCATAPRCSPERPAANGPTSAGPGAGVTVAVRDFAEQFPKEFAVRPEAVTVHLWPESSGKELDFRCPTLVRDYWRSWAELAPGGAAALARRPSNAQCAAKTHEIWLNAARGRPRSRRRRAPGPRGLPSGADAGGGGTPVRERSAALASPSP